MTRNEQSEASPGSCIAMGFASILQQSRTIEMYRVLSHVPIQYSAFSLSAGTEVGTPGVPA
jgi:hypothetical protein